MPYLAAAVIFVGLLCAINLLLTFAIIRRLREHTTQLAARSATRPLMASGTVLPDGLAVPRDFFTGPTLVGLFSTTCSACHDQLPEFTARAGSLGRALAVVVGDEEGARAFADAVAPVATLVVEPPDGPLSRAFQVPFFPAFYLVDEHAVIAAAALTPGELPLPAHT